MPQGDQSSGWNYSWKEWWNDAKCSLSGNCGGWPGDDGPLGSLLAFGPTSPLGGLGSGAQAIGAEGAAASSLGDIVPTVAARAASAFSSLSRASQYGVRQYGQLTGALKGTGLQAHHLIEQRFATLMGQNAREGLSIALTPAEHQAFTNAWRAAIPYGSGTANATVQQVQNAARQIYANYPEILKALGL